MELRNSASSWVLLQEYVHDARSSGCQVQTFMCIPFTCTRITAQPCELGLNNCSSNVRKCSSGQPWALSFLRQDFSLQTDRQGKECI
jgi:hypothetical protein